jgi:hypothetical protein
MNREDLINRLVARKLQKAGSKAKTICVGCVPHANVKK